MHNSDHKILAQLVSRLNDGTDQYRRAIELSQHAGNQAKFKCMVKSRAAAVSHLQPYISGGDTAPPVHAFGSVLHKIYPEILAGLTRDADAPLIAQIEDVERETLQLMQQALETLSSPLLKSVILDLHPKLPCTSHTRLVFEQAS